MNEANSGCLASDCLFEYTAFGEIRLGFWGLAIGIDGLNEIFLGDAVFLDLVGGGAKDFGVLGGGELLVMVTVLTVEVAELLLHVREFGILQF